MAARFFDPSDLACASVVYPTVNFPGCSCQGSGLLIPPDDARSVSADPSCTLRDGTGAGRFLDVRAN